LIRNFKQSTATYSTLDGIDEAMIIDSERPATSYRDKYIHSNLEVNQRTNVLAKSDDKMIDETRHTIAGELFKFQDEESGRMQRTQSVFQHLKNLIDDQQKNTIKYSNQSKNTSAFQTTSKNKIIEMIIERYLKEYEIDEDKWCNLLKEFTHRASESVKPHRFMLDDEIDVKIICNEWGSHTDSKYVNGVVVKKNVIDKRLIDFHNDPRILLLSNSLGYVRNDKDFTDFESIIKQEAHTVDIVKEKLARANPDIVVVEDDVSKKVLDTLRSENITIISNIDSDSMKRLERVTQTLIYPSIHLLESSTILGTCESFHIQRYNHKVRNGNKSAYVHTDRNLIFFEGTPAHLGCTILLFGDTIENLDKVKKCLHKMIHKARDVILESLFLSKINCNIQVSDPLADSKQMFLSYQNVFEDQPKFI